jgi:hypothetical protein
LGLLLIPISYADRLTGLPLRLTSLTRLTRLTRLRECLLGSLLL